MKLNTNDPWTSEEKMVLDSLVMLVKLTFGVDHVLIHALTQHPVRRMLSEQIRPPVPNDVRAIWIGSQRHFIVLADRLDVVWRLIPSLVHEGWHAADEKLAAIFAQGRGPSEEERRYAEEWAHKRAAESLFQLAARCRTLSGAESLVPMLREAAKRQRELGQEYRQR